MVCGSRDVFSELEAMHENFQKKSIHGEKPESMDLPMLAPLPEESTYQNIETQVLSIPIPYDSCEHMILVTHLLYILSLSFLMKTCFQDTLNDQTRAFQRSNMNLILKSMYSIPLPTMSLIIGCFNRMHLLSINYPMYLFLVICRSSGRSKLDLGNQ